RDHNRLRHLRRRAGQRQAHEPAAGPADASTADMPLLPTSEPRAQEDPDVQRREFIATAITAAGLPLYDTYSTLAESGRSVASTHRTVGRGDLDAVKEMASIFSRVDQRRGGGHARSAVVQYLNTDVSAYL